MSDRIEVRNPEEWGRGKPPIPEGTRGGPPRPGPVTQEEDSVNFVEGQVAPDRDQRLMPCAGGMPEDGHVLSVTVRDLGEMVILGGQGRIVRGSETAILCAAVQQHGRNVILDLSQVDAIDAAGIGALVALQAAGIYLTLVGPNQKVRDVLRDTALESVFEICDTLTDEAMEESNPGQSRGLVASGDGLTANR